jgi:DNA-binding transcriptional LysR family regulator
MKRINKVYAMELYQIRHFTSVAETGSFTKAAARAAVTQPALSVSIAKLEEELGVKLFHRLPKSVTLTPAGQRFQTTAHEILDACNKVKADLQATAADRPLRIGVLRTLPSAHLARLVETLQRGLAGTRIELVDGTREELEAQLSGRKLLACVSSKDGKKPGQRSVELLRERYGLAVSLQHRLASQRSVQLSDLNGERFIVRTHCEAFRDTTKLLAARGIRSRVVYKTDQDDRALALIGAGLGVALMPSIFEASNVKKVPVRDFHLKRVISLLWNADVIDDRLEQLIAFATTHNWASAVPYDIEGSGGASASAHTWLDRGAKRDEDGLSRLRKRIDGSAFKNDWDRLQKALERLR